MAGVLRYSRWDGSQARFELGADAVLSEIGDDVLYHGDLDAALRRLMRAGLPDPSGRRHPGLAELLERLRARRQEALRRHGLDGVADDIARQLDRVVGEERAALDRLERAARDSGDERRQEAAEQTAGERRERLDLLPPDLAGRVRELSDYEFVSPEAARMFEELVERLRAQLLQAHFNRMAGTLSSVGPEQMQRVKDMLESLNRMLEQRAAGEEPDFERFMAEFGDLFPGRPRSLDELLEQLAARMAAMQAVLASMSDEQREQLRALADQLLADLDLGWQLDRLAGNLRQAFPDVGWERRYDFAGRDPLGLVDAAGLAEDLGSIEELENLLQSATSPAALAEVDLEAARRLLGEDGADALERLAELARRLEEAGLVERREGRQVLTPRGLRALGQKALADVFTRLARDRAGRHQVDRHGAGPERSDESKPYEFGDRFDLDIERTLRNALRRSGPGKPVGLTPEDFEVARSEALTRSSTVLLLDLSLSMPMRDNFLAAKKVAMALHALISAQFPQDYLEIVGFGEVARRLRPEQLPEVTWDFNYGTNMQHALMLARSLLARRPGTRQVLMITDGEPTAHVLPGGEVFFNYPPVRETVEATVREVARCTQENIRINTFMLDATRSLKAFVERMTRLNRGRAFFTTPETLGSYVLVDFLEQRRTVRSRGGRTSVG